MEVCSEFERGSWSIEQSLCGYWKCTSGIPLPKYIVFIFRTRFDGPKIKEIAFESRSYITWLKLNRKADLEDRYRARGGPGGWHLPYRERYMVQIDHKLNSQRKIATRQQLAEYFGLELADVPSSGCCAFMLFCNEPYIKANDIKIREIETLKA